jgi:hypothetical protein
MICDRKEVASLHVPFYGTSDHHSPPRHERLAGKSTSSAGDLEKGMTKVAQQTRDKCEKGPR